MTQLRALSSDGRQQIVAIGQELENHVEGLIQNVQSSRRLRGHLCAKLLTLPRLDLLNSATFWFHAKASLRRRHQLASFASLFPKRGESGTNGLM